MHIYVPGVLLKVPWNLHTDWYKKIVYIASTKRNIHSMYGSLETDDKIDLLVCLVRLLRFSTIRDEHKGTHNRWRK